MPALNKLGQEIVRINADNGWNVTVPDDWLESRYKIPAVLALIHSEVSEALEAFRNNDVYNFSEEMADILIRVLDCAVGLGIDMDFEVSKKLERNKSRGFRHGGKLV